MSKLLVFESIYFNEKNFEHASKCFIERSNEQNIKENMLEFYCDNESDKVYKVYGDDNIKKFNRGNMENVKTYSKVIDTNIIVIDKFDLECKVMSKKEDNLEDEVFEGIDKNKRFIIKKEYEYICEKEIFRIIISQNSEKSSMNIRDSSMSKTYSYTYIIELKDEMDDIDMYIREMIFMIDANIYPLDKTEQKTVLSNYFKDVKDMFHSRVRLDIENPPMVRPKPATLERSNMLSNTTLGVISIMDNYVVTEKADGERYLLYIDEKGVGYLIANSNHVRGTGIKSVALSNSLFDGELVLCDSRKKMTDKDLFAIFDVYLLNTRIVTDLPFMLDMKGESRYNLMEEMISKIESDVYDVSVKKQLGGSVNESILDKCDKLLSMEFDYDIDGLIFTPMKLPVFGIYANKPIKFSDNQSWGRVFKWKPSDQNSIDFVVKDTGVIKKISGYRYREYKLLVGQRMDMSDISVMEGLRRMHSKEIGMESSYILKEFIIDGRECVSYVRIDDSNNKCYTVGEMKDIIHNNSVVEFVYDMNSTMITNERRWIPIRVRHDKNRIYKFGEGDIKGTANSYKVAENVWRTIMYPVTEMIIRGKEKLISTDQNIIDAENKYYNRISDNVNRNLISSKMNDFHNHVIKDMLYSYPSKRVSLLELGCGQGSDKMRWINSGYKYILGIDYTKDNITNPEAGIYSRFLNMKNNSYNRMYNGIPKCVFLVGDCTKSIKNGECSKELDMESYDILRYIYGRGRVVNKYESVGLKVGMFSNFDVVACMFSVHYFFETEQMLNGFLNNVASNTKSGKLLLTFMDGMEVQKILNANNGDVKGIDEVSGSLVWAIIRRFNPNQVNNYGKKIDVYLENTGKLIRENIVDFNLLVEKCKDYGLVLNSTGMFEDTFNDFKKKAKKQKSIDIIDGIDNNPILKQFSFLNRWCIFEKLDK